MRQESAEACFLEGNLVAVAALLRGAAFSDKFLDFFGRAARSLVAYRVVSELDFGAEAGDAALLAVAPFAVGHRCGVFLEGLFPFAAQVLFACAGVNKIPREYFVFFAHAVHPAGVIAAFFPDLLPFFKIKTVRVAFEDNSLLVGGVNHGAEPAVAAAVNGF